MRALVLVFALSLSSAAVRAAELPPAARSALDHLLERARQSHSDAVVVLRDGHEIAHYYARGTPPGPIDLMSVTKSVVALGIGQLLGEGKLKSLDQPVADFYPEWRQGRKKDITVRMLMNHTSGLQDLPRTDVEVYPAPDAVQLALAAELAAKPGIRWFYSNKAVNLLAGIIGKASGQPMDVFFRDGLFKTMDIHPGSWGKDETGHPYAFAGLALTAADLAKLGQLVLEHGNWHGHQLLPARYIDVMLAPAGDDGHCGLLWWRDNQWTRFETDPTSFDMLRRKGVPEATVTKLQRGLAGAHFDGAAAMFAGLQKVLGPEMRSILESQLVSRGIGPYRLFKLHNGPVVAFEGNGDGGQAVVVVPAAKLVAVRQIGKNGDQESGDESYEDFAAQVIDLAEALGALPAPGP